MRYITVLLFVLTLSITSANAQTQPPTITVPCEFTGVGTKYADGDQRPVVRCNTNGQVTVPRGTKFTVTVPNPKYQPPVAATCETVTTVTVGECRADNTAVRTTFNDVKELTPPLNGGLSCPQDTTVVDTVACVYTPPTNTRKIWGVVDNTPDIFGKTVLGTCSAEVHDKYVLPGPTFAQDGWLYRTWHPQVDSSGCVFGHNHGDDPNSMRDAEVLQHFDARFGLAAHLDKSMPGEPDGHVEAHEGFKIFVANLGDRNNDGFTNKMPTIAYNHMGTFRARRFSTRFHSHSISWVYAPDRSFFASYHAMLDTGGTGVVCDPRTAAPVKDVMALDQATRCGRPLDSQYEIWSMQIRIMRNGQELYRGFATPAAFDPITVFNPANPDETVYAWDPRMNAGMRFPDSRNGNRGCDLEAYAQSGYFYNQTGQTQFWMSPMGVVGPQGPNMLPLRLGMKNTQGGPGMPFASEIQQFKRRVSFCQNIGALSLKN